MRGRCCAAPTRRDLSGQPLRHRTGAHETGGARHPPGAEGAAEGAARAEKAARGPALAAAHALRPGAARGDGLLPRHRELLAPSYRPPARRTAPTLLNYFPERFLLSSTRATSPCRRSAACTAATARARRHLVEYGFRLPSALDNRPLNFEEFEGASEPGHLRFGDAGGTNSAKAAARWSSR
jgi:hypothetical protein